MTNLFYSDEELAQINEALGLQEKESKSTQRVDIDLHCGAFTIEVRHGYNTLLCNGSFVFSDPDIAKVYIALGQHLEGVGK